MITAETKLFLGIIGITLAIIVGAVFLFSKPAQSAAALTRQDVILAGTPTRGNPDAKVFLVEFSDFQCPACKAAKPAVDAVVAQYKDKLIFGYRHFPLDQHQFAVKAAIAAEAAKDQEKFWEMYDLLFANQEKFSDTIFTDLAKQLHLNMDQFSKSSSDSTIAARVQKDKDYGNQIGIAATPTFFLNGKKLDLTTFDDLKKAVADAVK